jgi:hypothetical protein
MTVSLLGQFQRSSKDDKAEGIIRVKIQGELDGLRQLVKGNETALYRFEVKPHDKRSLPQNARFHAMATEYGKAAGYTLDEAKAVLKHNYGVTIPFIEGFIPPTRTGQFVEIYGQIEFQVSTAEYDKAEMARLMEGAEIACAHLGHGV